MSEYAAVGRHAVELPAGVLRRTIKRLAATANLSKPAAKKRAKLEREMQGITTKAASTKVAVSSSFAERPA